MHPGYLRNQKLRGRYRVERRFSWLALQQFLDHMGDLDEIRGGLGLLFAHAAKGLDVQDPGGVAL